MMKAKILRRSATALVFLAVFLFYMAQQIDFDPLTILVLAAFSTIPAIFANLIWRLFEFLIREEKKAQKS